MMVRDVITDKRNHDMKLASESVTVNKIRQLCPTLNLIVVTVFM